MENDPFLFSFWLKTKFETEFRSFSEHNWYFHFKVEIHNRSGFTCKSDVGSFNQCL